MNRCSCRTETLYHEDYCSVFYEEDDGRLDKGEKAAYLIAGVTIGYMLCHAIATVF